MHGRKLGGRGRPGAQPSPKMLLRHPQPTVSSLGSAEASVAAGCMAWRSARERGSPSGDLLAVFQLPGEGLWFPKAGKATDYKTVQLQALPGGIPPPQPRLRQSLRAQQQGASSLGRQAQVPGLRPCSKCWQDSVGASPARCTQGAHSPR